MKQSADKKTERVEVRVSHAKKRAFAEACETQGDTPSGAVRRFINSYIRRADRDDIAAALRFGPIRKRLVLVAGVAAILIVGISGIMLYNHTSSGLTSEALFAAYDTDGSGILEPLEISANDHHLHRVLNIDGDDGISPSEFINHGTMVWKFIVPEDWIVTHNESTIMGVTKTMQSRMRKLPEGSYIPTGNPEKPFLTPEEFVALGMSMSEVQKNLKN